MKTDSLYRAVPLLALFANQAFALTKINRVELSGEVVRLVELSDVNWVFPSATEAIPDGPCFQIHFNDPSLRKLTAITIESQSNVMAKVEADRVDGCLNKRSATFSLSGKSAGVDTRKNYLIDLPFQSTQIVKDPECERIGVKTAGNVNADDLSFGVVCDPVDNTQVESIEEVHFRIQSQGLRTHQVHLNHELRGRIGLKKKITYEVLDASNHSIGSFKIGWAGFPPELLKRYRKPRLTLKTYIPPPPPTPTPVPIAVVKPTPLPPPPPKKVVVKKVFRPNYLDIQVMVGPSSVSHDFTPVVPGALAQSFKGNQLHLYGDLIYKPASHYQTLIEVDARMDVLNSLPRSTLISAFLEKPMLNWPAAQLFVGLGVDTGNMSGTDYGIDQSFGVAAKLRLASRYERWSVSMLGGPLFTYPVSVGSYWVNVKGFYHVYPFSLPMSLGFDLNMISVSSTSSGKAYDYKWQSIALLLGYHFGHTR